MEIFVDANYGIVITDWLKDLQMENYPKCEEDDVSDEYLHKWGEWYDLDNAMYYTFNNLKSVFKKNRVRYWSSLINDNETIFLKHNTFGWKKYRGSQSFSYKLPTKTASKQMNTELQNVIKAIAKHYGVANPKLKTELIVTASEGW